MRGDNGKNAEHAKHEHACEQAEYAPTRIPQATEPLPGRERPDTYKIIPPEGCRQSGVAGE